MNDATLGELLAMALQFRDEREWKQFHNFKDLAIKLCLEAAEVLEHAEWKTPEQLHAELGARREAIGEELADVLQMVLLLAEHVKIDLADAYKRKLQKNAQRYPVEKAKGSAKKYTEL